MTPFEYAIMKRNQKYLEEFAKSFQDESTSSYALGKQTETITQDEIEKAAEKYADEIKIPVSLPGVMVPFINGLAHDSYLQGAQDFLGKQEAKQEPGAEDNEMLSVPKSKVQRIYSYNEEILSQDPTHSGAILLKKKLKYLFGSKCLPDNVATSAPNVDSLAPNVDSLATSSAPLSQNPAENCDNENHISKSERLHIADARLLQGLLADALIRQSGLQ